MIEVSLGVGAVGTYRDGFGDEPRLQQLLHRIGLQVDMRFGPLVAALNEALGKQARYFFTDFEMLGTDGRPDPGAQGRGWSSQALQCVHSGGQDSSQKPAPPGVRDAEWRGRRSLCGRLIALGSRIPQQDRDAVRDGDEQTQGWIATHQGVAFTLKPGRLCFDHLGTVHLLAPGEVLGGGSQGCGKDFPDAGAAVPGGGSIALGKTQSGGESAAEVWAAQAGGSAEHRIASSRAQFVTRLRSGDQCNTIESPW